MTAPIFEKTLLPAAIFAGVDLTWWDAVHSWIFAFIGNLVGAAVFVAGSYWFLYTRGDEGDQAGGDATSQRLRPQPRSALRR